MNILCQGSLGLLRVMSFISLVKLANAPQLDRLSLPQICIGERLELRWMYDFQSVTAGNITWTFDPSGHDNEPIILAVMDLANWTFQINRDVEPRYKKRLLTMMEDDFPAGIKLLNVSEADEGKYGVRISVDKPKLNSSTDEVEFSLVNVTSYSIVLNSNHSICSIESNTVTFSWNFVDKNYPKYKTCLKPLLTEWRKNGEVIATKSYIDDVMKPAKINTASLRDSGYPLNILIDQSKATDAGNYTVTASYGNFNIKSGAIQLNVSISPSISKVADIRQCVGTNVTLPWKFNPGTDCENKPQSVGLISWTQKSVGSHLASYDDYGGVFLSLNKRVIQDKLSNAGILLLNVSASDAGTYEVVIELLDGDVLNESTNVTVETRQIPKIFIGYAIPNTDPLTVKKCEGESFVFNCTLKYPGKNLCPYAEFVGHRWYLNGLLISSKKRTTTTKKPSSTAPTTTIKDPHTRITDPQKSSHSESSGTQGHSEVTGSGKDTTVGKTMSLSSQSPTTLPERLLNLESGDLRDFSEESGSGEDTTPGSETFFMDETFDADLAVYKVKPEHGGNYSVNVSFDTSTNIDDVISENYITLEVMKAPVVSRKQKSEKTVYLCTDNILHLQWNLELNGCGSDIYILWKLHPDNKTKDVSIGAGRRGTPTWCNNYRNRVNPTDDVSLEIRNLKTSDSGTYIVRLRYITDKSVNISRRPDLKGNVFSESKINVKVYDIISEECTGSRLAKLNVSITRNDEDVQKSTNKTVFLNDTITLSIDLPPDAGIVVAQFLWKETRHTYLKQFFGKKFYHAGHCWLKFKILKSLPGIRFQPKEYRREVQFGMKMIFLENKNLTLLTSFYFRNHKYPTDTPPPEPESKVGKSYRPRSGLVRQCVSNGQTIIAAAIFGILVLQQQHP